jgi:hypothetical protein
VCMYVHTLTLINVIRIRVRVVSFENIFRLRKHALSKINACRTANLVVLRMPLSKSMLVVSQTSLFKHAFSNHVFSLDFTKVRGSSRRCYLPLLDTLMHVDATTKL